METLRGFLRHRNAMDSPQQNGTSGFQSLVVKRTKSWLDPLAVFTAVFLTLFFYVYEVFYVMPQLLGNFGQTVHFVVATWLAYNILGNLRICTKTKNSVDTLPSELLKPRKGEEHLWHFCDKCHRTVPPRSWHCKICNVCILKRDHHCNFVGNCVGHNNQRYFIWFSFYATIGSGLALFDNALFAFKHHVEVINIFSVNNLLIREYYSPGASSDFGLQCLLRFVFWINICAVLFPGVLFFTQISMVRTNSVMFNTSDRTYDMGLERNCTQVFGRRRFWTFLSPNIKSPLPHDGTRWQSKPTI
ncbi:probable palmitoyltransferase ZDHHC24 [Drosophila gunungcola]|uniref:probable palmitoyltransferase ZDHHC24 n=1 Tax=Drosophila gunungcola TaxID=103775 RepID=UPI0022DF07C8|nr:probable palmitoyltransferase ZDHHC24 [Drosophila gunungcola]